MQEAEIGLGDHGTAVHTDTGHFQGSPHGVAAEQLVVAGDAGELDHTELHDQMVDEFLGLALGEDAAVQVTLDIDIQEGGHTAHAHGGAVLGLDGGQVAEVQPLDGLLGIGSRLGDVVTVGGSHLLHALQGLDLQRNFFPLADHIIQHGAVAAVGEVILLFLDQEVDAVQRHTAVITHNAAAAVGVGQTGDDVAVTGLAHFGGVGIKHSLVVSTGIFGKDLVQFGTGGITVGGAGLFCHLDAAVGHKGTLEGLVGLQADDLLQILEFGVDIAGAVCRQTGNHLGLHVQNAALGALLFLQLLQGTPQLVGGFGRTGQETFVAVVRFIVFLDEVTGVDFFLPDAAFKAFPLFEVCHKRTPSVRVSSHMWC